MKHKFLLMTTILLFGLALGCIAQEKEIIKEPNPIGKKKSEKYPKVKEKENMKVLAKGSYSKVETPFIYVARDKSALKNLKEMARIDALKDDIDLEKNLVLGAFAGTLRTGGYSVIFEEKENSIFVKLKRPPKDAMVTQALTQPFQIILLPAEKFNSSKLKLSGQWKNKAQNYRVKSGKFEFSGGFAGIRREFEPRGHIEVFKLNGLITFIVDLDSLEEDENRTLFDVVSTRSVEENILPVKINSGNFITPPHPEMLFKPLLKDDRLSFDLKTDDKGYPISDGFKGKGTFQAVKK